MGEYLTKPVFFVGFMGAGKTSAARKLARRCGCASVDADIYISRSLGIRSSDYIRQYGEEAYRKAELEALHALIELGPAFISMGGGAVETEECRSCMKDAGYVVFFKISAQEAANRISNIKTRPLFGDIEHAEDLNRKRTPMYESVADFTYEVHDSGVKGVAETIRRHLIKEGILVIEE